MSIDQAKEFFDLDDNFTKQKLTRKYREMCKKYHPDVNHENNAEEMMQKINKSYDLLKTHLKNIDNFDTYKEEKQVKLNEFLSSLTHVDFSNYDEKIKRIYECAKTEESNIYSKLSEDLKNTKTKNQVDNIIKEYRTRIKRLINSFVGVMYISYNNQTVVFNLDPELRKLILLFKENFKNYHTINEAAENFKLFTQSIEAINYKIKNSPKDKITMILERMLIPYINNKYYKELESKVNEIIENNIQKYSCNSFDEKLVDREVERVTSLISIDINKLFSEYSKFADDKKEKINSIYDITSKLNKDYNNEVLIYASKYLSQLNTITNKYEFYNYYNEFSKDIVYMIDEFDVIYKNKNELQKYRNIVEDLISKFSIASDKTMLTLPTNLSILYKATTCLLLAERSSIDIEEISYLNEITFSDIKRDKKILDFVDEQLFNIMRKQSDYKLKNESNIKIKKRRK